MQKLFSTLVFLLNVAGGFPLHADEFDHKHPFGDQLRVLAEDVQSALYRAPTVSGVSGEQT
jgi:hypothetical protein